VIKNANPTFPEVVIDATHLQRESGYGLCSGMVIRSKAAPCNNERGYGERRWSRYLVGVLEGLAEHNQGRPLRGFSGLITSDVPTGAGISSSHSLVLAFMTCCLLANPDIVLTPIQVHPLHFMFGFHGLPELRSGLYLSLGGT
jgi:hypothetical protein